MNTLKQSTEAPQFDDFRYTGNFDQSIIDEMIANRRDSRLYVPTGFSSDAGEQELVSYRTIPPNLKSDVAIARLTAWSDDNGRPDGELFDSHLALSTGMQVVTINNPGVESRQWADEEQRPTQFLTPDQIEELRETGSFRKVGAAVMNGFRHLGIGTYENPMLVHASSMAVAVAGGAINHGLNEGVIFDGVALAEPVNHITWVNKNGKISVPTLGRQFANQGKYAKNYVAMNPVGINKPENGLKFVRRVIESRQANWLYVKAMARGTFMLDLGNIEGLEDVPTVVARGAGSTLSPQEPLGEMAVEFQRVVKNFDTITYGDPETNPHTHPATMTVEESRRRVVNVS